MIYVLTVYSGSYIWPAASAPGYIPGWSATCGFMAIVALCALSYKFILPRFPEPEPKFN